jgi:peptidoglycan/xylan/chitin deacetylase (PgdA/CDA1 family)
VNKRLLLANLCESTGTTEALLAKRARRQAAWLPILTFHRVHAIERGVEFPFDEGVVDTDPRAFERQVEVIAKYFRPVGIDDVVRYFDGAALPVNPVLVTFDDGYRDNHELALPILKRYGVRAVFFIATDYVTRRKLFWWDRINYVIKKSRRREIALEYPYALALRLWPRDERRAAIEILLRLVKSWIGLDLERFLVELATACRVELEPAAERALADESLMTWDHVRELRAAGMDVQSHTRTHRVLQTLDPRALADELLGSRRDLERELGEPVTAISYPVGQSIAKVGAIRRALVDAGYKIGFTNQTGTVPLGAGIDRFDVNRIALDRQTPDALFRAMLALPIIFD